MKTVESLKYYLMGHTSRSMEDSGAKSYLNCLELAQEVSEKKNLIFFLEIICMVFW